MRPRYAGYTRSKLQSQDCSKTAVRPHCTTNAIVLTAILLPPVARFGPPLARPVREGLETLLFFYSLCCKTLETGGSRSESNRFGSPPCEYLKHRPNLLQKKRPCPNSPMPAPISPVQPSPNGQPQHSTPRTVSPQSQSSVPNGRTGSNPPSLPPSPPLFVLTRC